MGFGIRELASPIGVFGYERAQVAQCGANNSAQHHVTRCYCRSTDDCVFNG